MDDPKGNDLGTAEDARLAAKRLLNEWNTKPFRVELRREVRKAGQTMETKPQTLMARPARFPLRCVSREGSALLLAYVADRVYHELLLAGQQYRWAVITQPPKGDPSNAGFAVYEVRSGDKWAALVELGTSSSQGVKFITAWVNGRECADVDAATIISMIQREATGDLDEP